jgi:hypothetical protein
MEANLTNLKKTVNSLNEFVGGSGNLLNKKSLAIAAACGRASDANWLKYCIPGSSHHFTRLKQPPLFFTSPDQVMQLVHRLSVLGDKNGPMNGPKVDEVLCKTLRGTWETRSTSTGLLASPWWHALQRQAGIRELPNSGEGSR